MEPPDGLFVQLVLYYEGKKIEFVPNFTYLGVIMQTKGGYSGHIQNLKRKGISACTRVALRLPLTSMSLQSLERLLYITMHSDLT